MVTYILYIKCVLVWWWLYTTSNNSATFEVAFVKKFCNTEADLKKKTLIIKNALYSTNKIFKLLQNLFFIYLFIYSFANYFSFYVCISNQKNEISSIRVIFFHNEAALSNTAQKMKFSIKDFFSKCDQIRSFLRIWSHLLKKLLMENFMFCLVKSICQMSILNGTWEYF